MPSNEALSRSFSVSRSLRACRFSQNRDLAELEAWAGRLAELGVDNSGVHENAYGTLLSFSDPDGNAFDFIVPARATSN